MGAIAPVHNDKGWLLAPGRGFARLSPGGSLSPIADDVAPAGTRMNDAACDPQGRFWAGTWPTITPWVAEHCIGSVGTGGQS